MCVSDGSPFACASQESLCGHGLADRAALYSCCGHLSRFILPRNSQSDHAPCECPGVHETGHTSTVYAHAPHSQEQEKFDADPSKHMRLWEGVNARTGARFCCGVGVERFLGPETLFRPDMVTAEPAQPLPEARRMAGLHPPQGFLSWWAAACVLQACTETAAGQNSHHPAGVCKARPYSSRKALGCYMAAVQLS